MNDQMRENSELLDDPLGGIDLKQVIRAILRRKLLITLFLILGTVIALGISIRN